MSPSSKRNARIAAAALIAALLFACRPSLVPAAPASPSTRSGVSVTVPLVSPTLQRVFGIGSGVAGAARSGASARTYLGLNRVEMRLYDASDALVDEIVVSMDYSNYSGMNATGDFLASPGTGYRVHVDIFNSFVSDTQAICSGDSSAFAIAAGSFAEVGVTCAPNAPAPLALETESAEIALVPGMYELDIMQITTGAEAWYSFTAASTSSEVITIPTTPNAYGYVVVAANSDGSDIFSYDSTTIAPGFSLMLGQPPVYSMILPTEIGKTYFLGVMCIDFKIRGGVYVPAGNFRMRVTATPSATPIPSLGPSPTPIPPASPTPAPSAFPSSPEPSPAPSP